MKLPAMPIYKKFDDFRDSWEAVKGKGGRLPFAKKLATAGVIEGFCRLFSIRINLMLAFLVLG
jgi:hypothetical protein